MTKRFARRSLRDIGYDYFEAVKDDVVTMLDEDYYYEPDKFDNMDDDELEEYVNDEYFVKDRVTGNASGSYFFDNSKSREAVEENFDLLREAVSEFATKEELADKFMDEDWEWMDVTIRCYVLGQVAGEAAKEFRKTHPAK